MQLKTSLAILRFVVSYLVYHQPNDCHWVSNSQLITYQDEKNEHEDVIMRSKGKHRQPKLTYSL